jgi:hypothetical protein
MITKQQYVEYLLATPVNYTCANLADHLDDVSHDAVSDYLRRERHTARTVWELAQSLITDSPDAYLILDDSLQDKRYSRKIDLVKRQYSGTEGGLVRGIGVVNLVHSTGKDGDFFPVDYRIYAPTADGKTKNDHFREMLIAAVADKRLQARTILFDTWYASANNFKVVQRYLLNNYRQRLKNEDTNPIRKPSTLGEIYVYPGLLRRYVQRMGRIFYTTVKRNRRVSLTKKDGYIGLEEIDWTEERLTHGVVVRLHKVPFPVLLFKLVATNGDIDWVITNDLDETLTAQVAQDANDVRWEVEDLHRGGA